MGRARWCAACAEALLRRYSDAIARSRTLALHHALTLNRFWNNRQRDAFVWKKRLKASHGCSGRTCSRA